MFALDQTVRRKNVTSFDSPQAPRPCAAKLGGGDVPGTWKSWKSEPWRPMGMEYLHGWLIFIYFYSKLRGITLTIVIIVLNGMTLQFLWICLFGDFFTDCTMGFIILKPSFGRFCLLPSLPNTLWVQTPTEKAFRGSKHLLRRPLEHFGRLGTFLQASPANLSFFRISGFHVRFRGLLPFCEFLLISLKLTAGLPLKIGLLPPRRKKILS